MSADYQHEEELHHLRVGVSLPHCQRENEQEENRSFLGHPGAYLRRVVHEAAAENRAVPPVRGG